MGQQYPRPVAMSDAQFLAWCQDESIPVTTRTAAYLERVFDDDHLAALTPDHARLWTAIQTRDAETLEERGWLQDDWDRTARWGTDPGPHLTAEATLMFFQVVAVRTAEDGGDPRPYEEAQAELQDADDDA